MRYKLEFYRDGGFWLRIGRLRVWAAFPKITGSLYPNGLFIVYLESKDGEYNHFLIDLGQEKSNKPN